MQVPEACTDTVAHRVHIKRYCGMGQPNATNKEMCVLTWSGRSTRHAHVAMVHRDSSASWSHAVGGSVVAMAKRDNFPAVIACSAVQSLPTRSTLPSPPYTVRVWKGYMLFGGRGDHDRNTEKVDAWLNPR